MITDCDAVNSIYLSICSQSAVRTLFERLAVHTWEKFSKENERDRAETTAVAEGNADTRYYGDHTDKSKLCCCTAFTGKNQFSSLEIELN